MRSDDTKHIAVDATCVDAKPELRAEPNVVRVTRRVLRVLPSGYPFAAVVLPSASQIITALGLNGEHFTSLDNGLTWRLVRIDK